MSQFESSEVGGIPSYLEGQPFVLVSPSTDWVRLTTLRRAI